EQPQHFLRVVGIRPPKNPQHRPSPALLAKIMPPRRALSTRGGARLTARRQARRQIVSAGRGRARPLARRSAVAVRKPRRVEKWAGRLRAPLRLRKPKRPRRRALPRLRPYWHSRAAGRR